jgi:hypothetical protein
MRPPALVPLAAALASLALTGCGISGKSPLTAAELASQGSAICERAKAEEDTLQVQSLQGMRLAIPRLEEIGARELTALSKLSPPASERRSYNELLKTGSEVNALLKPLSSALATDGSAPPELLAHGRALTGRLATVAGPLGMSSCSASSPAAG